MHALDQEQFRRYADGQLSMVAQMLAGHQTRPGGYCSCGRQLPCSVVQHATATREHYTDKLALLDTTVLLPVLAPAAPKRPVPLWRRVLRGRL